MTDHIAPDLDRLQLSAELWALATRYTIEATLAELVPDASKLGKAARLLNLQARRVLTVGSVEVADQWARAAALHIGLVESARRASWAINAQPRVRRCVCRDGRACALHPERWI